MNRSSRHIGTAAILVLSAVLPMNRQLLQAQYQRSCSGESRPGAFAQYYLPQTGGTQTLTIDLPNSTRWSVTNPARISWITINSSARGMGKGSFTVSLAPNASSSCRFDSLSILINNSQQLPLHIWQDGLPSVKPAGTVVNLPPIGAKADVAGTWKGTMETQTGPTETTITIQAGAPLAGNVKFDNGFEGKIEKAKLEGDKISFEINIQYGTVSFAGTVSGDEMKLNVTGTTGNKMTLIAKRQKQSHFRKERSCAICLRRRILSA